MGSSVSESVRHTRVLIVGAGFAGLGMALQLTRRGRRDFLILEQADAVGGTWRQNTYPGCECDIPSVLYSYSFAPKTDWTSSHAGQPEILDYLTELTERHGLRDRLQFGTEVAGARWDETDCRWHVFDKSGREFVAQYLVVASGALNVPRIPRLPGAETFAGASMHSAAWRDDVDLTGRRVALIGTGASGIQLAPHLAERAAELTVFQRTPAWILPRRRFRTAVAASRRSTLARNLFRAATYWGGEALGVGLGRPRLLERTQNRALAHLRKQVHDTVLRDALTPDYRIGCKRILRSNDFYPTLARPNTTLVTDPITAIQPSGIETADGTRHDVDVIVYATGFRVAGALNRMNLIGRGGVSLLERWQQDGVRTHLGVTMSGMPNAFFLSGPNTGLGHNSVIVMIEAQIAHALDAMRLAEESGAGTVEVRAAAQDAFDSSLRERLSRGVWSTGGCASWYLDARGSNHALWPGTSWDYRRRTRVVDPADYQLLRAESHRGLTTPKNGWTRSDARC
ncbi:flavin-containing monooxygenase [Prescottella equi]|uniref:4-hydroxyacetophenone monooxygenase n=1 Tax=Rhodococcus hoagii TaxID=43767 RepID=A0AAE5IT78_RHOHA|nr:NAD(P)/FAD-dependent oxidoreductase [Prescottella equi]ERN43386.1 monooxygenase [Prescottella equi NBRC 101255 = C 7]MBM4629245.1 NAD(P)-binding domain-containing protein [Prescottella equi]ORL10030.1 4-hydroxyacetophenone monooxygenase [Prescottella equi]ORL27439.1 4-hydroxyacetophenone monooxygenase [Prescottella equi]ORM01739.1 4-hydroxyacetophenone monooxygenase [Prescottella equi]